MNYMIETETITPEIEMKAMEYINVGYQRILTFECASGGYNWWEGVDNPLTHFDDLETWKYATPHSIRLWTPRTEVAEGSSCGASCHLGIPGGSPGNADWYLWKDYVDTNFPLEADANDGVVVDGMLPDDWTNE